MKIMVTGLVVALVIMVVRLNQYDAYLAMAARI